MENLITSHVQFSLQFFFFGIKSIVYLSLSTSQIQDNSKSISIHPRYIAVISDRDHLMVFVLDEHYIFNNSQHF